jgi:hypothetical protein
VGGGLRGGQQLDDRRERADGDDAGGLDDGAAREGPACGPGLPMQPPAPPHPQVGVQNRPPGEAHEEMLAARLDGLDRAADEGLTARRGGDRREHRVEGHHCLGGERRVEGARGAPDGVALGHGPVYGRRGAGARRGRR